MSANANTREERWLNPVVLKWAREWRGRTLEEAARKTDQKNIQKVVDWESGERTPTVNQARTLANFYDRPFLELLLPRPPALPEPVSLADFRMHQDAQPPSKEWELQDIQQWAETQRINALDLLDEIGDEPPLFPATLFASLGDSPGEVASRSRELLEFPIESQIQMTLEEAKKLPDILRHLFESIGVIPLKRTELAGLKVRGICIAQFPLPAIVFTKEAPTAQTFTLVHEFAHVLLRKSGVSGAIEQRVNPHNVEDWCNRFAAAFLMPASYLETLLGNAPEKPADNIDDARLSSLAKRMNVSRHATLIRLVHLGYVHRDYYWTVKRPVFDREEQEYRGGGRATYYGNRYRSKQGDLYTGLVLEAWSNDRITNHNAAEFMGIKKLEHLEAIRDHFGDA